MKKYNIILKDTKDKEEFCDQMDRSFSSLSKGFIPQRSCDCVAKRPMSKNTTYIITKEEADFLKNDTRIKDVELAPEEIPGAELCNTIFKPDPNIEIYRPNCVKNTIDNIENVISAQNLGECSLGDKYATIANVPTGEGVDVVIVDDYVEANHPEFAENPNGTGASRVNRINWRMFDQQVLGYSTNNDYDYTIDNQESHGSHTAGIVAGNTCGWAKKSNIYTISPFHEEHWADYIRAFHNSKSTNTPTVINNSWGYRYNFSTSYMDNIDSVNYRGRRINRPAIGWNLDLLYSYGIVTQTNGYLLFYNIYLSSVSADVDAMVNDGIIVVTSAGNNFAKCDVPSGIDYNNYFTIFGYDLYYMRGSSPNTESSISVGSIASLKINGGECKTEYSNCGPAVDVYAPGDAIMSSVLACQGFPCMVDERDYLNYPDHRYGFDKYTGTSMSGPQVTGMLACIASSNTSLNQDSAKAYISTNSKSTITNGTIFRDLQGSPNRYLYYSGASVHYP